VTERWPLALRLLHWTTAIILLVTIPVVYAAMALTEIDTDRAEALASLHILLGLAILVLTLTRLAARYLLPRPAPAAKGLPRLLAGIATVSLYVLLLALPITGILKLALSGLDVSAFGVTLIPSGPRSPALARTLNVAHAWLAKGLIALVLAHAAAAILHRPLFGRTIIRRMV
jgi:cytochrome b561